MARTCSAQMKLKPNQKETEHFEDKTLGPLLRTPDTGISKPSMKTHRLTVQNYFLSLRLEIKVKPV